MPVHRRGRYVYANPEELNRWLNKESPFHLQPHIATENEDLVADLKRSLKEAKITESRPAEPPDFRRTTRVGRTFLSDEMVGNIHNPLMFIRHRQAAPLSPQ